MTKKAEWALFFGILLLALAIRSPAENNMVTVIQGALIGVGAQLITGAIKSILKGRHDHHS
jgi:hypothetical protein